MMQKNNQWIALGLGVWFLLALAAGGAGLLTSARPPFPQLLIAVLTGFLLICCWAVKPLREWTTTVEPAALVWLHVTRYVGFYFIYLLKRGELPEAFAKPAGWGDIAVATTALIVAFYRPPPVGEGRKIYLFWNILGFVDIVLVVITAARVGIANPDSLRALIQLPLSLLPTFLVPLILATHLLLFWRLWKLSDQQSPKP